MKPLNLDGSHGPPAGREPPRAQNPNGPSTGLASDVDATGVARRSKYSKGLAPSTELRVGVIATLITLGQPRAKIMENVARLHAKENEDRAAGRPVVEVWGEVAPASRTIDKYIALGRKSIRDDARRLPKSADFVLGLQWARINELYEAARRDKRYYVCTKLLEITAAMFGLNAAIKLQIGAQDGDEDAGAVDMRHLPVSTMTQRQATSAFGSLMDRLGKEGRAIMERERDGHAAAAKYIGNGEATVVPRPQGSNGNGNSSGHNGSSNHNGNGSGT